MESKLQVENKVFDKAWANRVLRLAIAEINNADRVLSARRVEVFYLLGELERLGYWWQVARLRNHINLGIKKGVFTLERSESDPLSKVGGLS